MDMPVMKREAPMGTERRSGDRQISVLINAGLEHKGVDALCRIRNLSSGGVMIETGLPLAAEDMVALHLRTGRLVRGTVRWVADGHAGIAFEPGCSADWITEKPGPESFRTSPIGYPLFRREAKARVIVSAKQARAVIVAISPIGITVENERDWGSDPVFTVAVEGLGSHVARLSEHQDPDDFSGHMSLLFVQPLNFALFNDWLNATPRPMEDPLLPHGLGDAGRPASV